MEFRQALGEVIRTERQANGLQLRELASRAFISYSFLSEVERGIKEASSEVLDSIATGMRMKTYELILKTGYLMADFQIPDTSDEFFQTYSDDSFKVQFENARF